MKKTLKATIVREDDTVEVTPRLNAEWHEAHRMPPRATLAQRLAWHRAHAKACGCRPIPAKLRALLG